MQRELSPLEPRLLWLDPAALQADAAAAARAWSWLDEGERARHARFASESRRTEFLAAHALLRASLSGHARLPPEGWRFVQDARGRPSLDPAHGCGWLRFSLTHTEGLVVVALARDREVGVDAEDRERRLDWAAVVRQFFSPLEAAGLEALATEEARRERFFALWTLKEAYLKARGVGLAQALRSVVLHVEGASGGSLVEPRPDGVDGRPAWQFTRFSPTARHRVAACIARPPGDEECAWVVREVRPASWSGE